MAYALPTSLRAGYTWRLAVAAADIGYAASDGWALKARFTPRAAGAAIDVNAAAAGDDFLFDVAAAATAGWVAGLYTQAWWVEHGDGRVEPVGDVQATILPNLRNLPAGTDTRTQAEKALDDARAAFAAWTPSSRRYRIGDREREFNSAAEIRQVISHWEGEVARERGQAAPGQGGRFFYRHPT